MTPYRDRLRKGEYSPDKNATTGGPQSTTTENLEGLTGRTTQNTTKKTGNGRRKRTTT